MTAFPIVCDRPTKRPRKLANDGALAHLQTSNTSAGLPRNSPLPSEPLPISPPGTYFTSKVPISSLISSRPSPSPSPVRSELPRMDELLLGSQVHGESGQFSHTAPFRPAQPTPTLNTHRMHSEGPSANIDSANARAFNARAFNTREESTSVQGKWPKIHHQADSNSGGSLKQKVIPCPYEFCQKTFSRNSNLKGK